MSVESAKITESSEKRPMEGLRWKLMALIIVLIIGAQILLSFFAYRSFQSVLAPQVEQQAVIIGETVKDRLVNAVALGMPLNELVGVPEFFELILADNPDIDYLAVVDPDGRTIFSSGFDDPDDQSQLHDLQRADGVTGPVRHVAKDHYDTALLIQSEGRGLGELHVGVAKSFVQNELQEIVFDVLTVLVVSMLLVLELVLIFIVLRISMPMRLVSNVLTHVGARDFTRRLMIRSNDEIGRFCGTFDQLIRRVNQSYNDLVEEAQETKAGQINRDVVQRIDGIMSDLKKKFSFSSPGEERQMSALNALRIRAPLFLFMFSEELSRSFLPIYVRELYTPIDGLSVDVVIGLPITIFMIVVAVMTPIAGVWADRFGARNLFLLGTLPAAVGYLGASAASGVTDFLIWRCFSAIGYGMIFIAAQGYIARTTGKSSRAGGMAIFVGAVAAATICGPSIGGILADRIGFRATFLVSTALALISAIVVYTMLEEDRDRGITSRRARWKDVVELLTDRRFFALTIFAAIPTKMLLAGFLFYLAPIYLFDLGNNQSTIGRVMMVYGLIAISLTPFAARLADRHSWHRILVAGGGLVAGLGCLAIFQVENTWMILLAIVMMGLGHSMSMAPQLALVQQIGEESHPDLGQATVMASFRLLERIGTVIGPLVAGLLSTALGYRDAMIGLGLIVLVCAILFIVLQRRGGRLSVEAAS